MKETILHRTNFGDEHYGEKFSLEEDDSGYWLRMDEWDCSCNGSKRVEISAEEAEVLKNVFARLR